MTVNMLLLYSDTKHTLLLQIKVESRLSHKTFCLDSSRQRDLIEPFTFSHTDSWTYSSCKSISLIIYLNKLLDSNQILMCLFIPLPGNEINIARFFWFLRTFSMLNTFFFHNMLRNYFLGVIILVVSNLVD